MATNNDKPGSDDQRKRKKPKHASLIRSSAAEYLTFVAAAGSGGVEAVYADESIWLTQKMMSMLYGVNVRTINEHLQNIFSDSELQQEAVIRKFRITASDNKTSETRLNRFIAATDRKILQDAGKVTAEIARAHAESELEKYRIVQDRVFESDFDRAVKLLNDDGEEQSKP